jgi:hypothetical protein
MRLKLINARAERELGPDVFESSGEAQISLTSQEEKTAYRPV